MIRMLAADADSSISAIAARVGVSRSTVRRTLLRAAPPSHRRAPPRASHASRRRLATRQAAVRAMARETVRKTQHRAGPRSQLITLVYRRFPSAASIVIGLAALHNIKCSVSTVKRDLKGMGFRSVRRPAGPLRVIGDVEDRLAFCRAVLKQKTAKPFHKILFTDEKTAQCSERGQRRDWTENVPLRRSLDQGSPRLVLWAAVGVGFRKLIVLGAHYVNDQTYIPMVLEPCRAVLRRRCFQFDNAVPHKSHKTKRWIAATGVQTIETTYGLRWPPRSPDLSPVETIWAIVDARVKRHHHPMNVNELRHAWETEFNGLDQAIIDRTCASFEQRCRQCIKEKGATIRPKSLKRARSPARGGN